MNELIERLQKAIDLTEPMYLEIENTDTHIYYVSDAIGDAIVHLLKYKQQEEMREWNL